MKANQSPTTCPPQEDEQNLATPEEGLYFHTCSMEQSSENHTQEKGQGTALTLRDQQTIEFVMVMRLLIYLKKTMHMFSAKYPRVEEYEPLTQRFCTDIRRDNLVRIVYRAASVLEETLAIFSGLLDDESTLPSLEELPF